MFVSYSISLKPITLPFATEWKKNQVTVLLTWVWWEYMNINTPMICNSCALYLRSTSFRYLLRKLNVIWVENTIASSQVGNFEKAHFLLPDYFLCYKTFMFQFLFFFLFSFEFFFFQNMSTAINELLQRGIGLWNRRMRRESDVFD